MLRLLWTEETAIFVGKHYLEQAVSDPKPVQRPHPRIWAGSIHYRDGWARFCRAPG